MNHRQSRTFGPFIGLLLATFLTEAAAKIAATSFTSQWNPHHLHKPVNYVSYNQFNPLDSSWKPIASVSSHHHEEQYPFIEHSNHEEHHIIEHPSTSIESPEILDQISSGSQFNYRRQRPPNGWSNYNNFPRKDANNFNRYPYDSYNNYKYQRNKNRLNRRTTTTTTPFYDYYDDYYDFTTKFTPRRRPSLKRRPPPVVDNYNDSYEDENDSYYDDLYVERTTRPYRRKKRTTTRRSKPKKPPRESSEETFEASEESTEKSVEEKKVKVKVKATEKIDVKQERQRQTTTTTTTEGSTTTEESSTTIGSDTTTISSTTTPGAQQNTTSANGYGPGGGYDNISFTYGPSVDHHYAPPYSSGYPSAHGNEVVANSYPTPIFPLFHHNYPYSNWVPHHEITKNAIVKKVHDLVGYDEDYIQNH